MPKETMTPRERWTAVLKHEMPDRTPMDYWGTDEFARRLLRYLGEDNLHSALKRLHVDFVITPGPRYVGPKIPAGSDVYGCRYEHVSYETGVYDECVYNPLAQYNSVAEIEADYIWPNPDWWDYSDLPRQIQGWENYPIRGGGSEPFLIYKNLRGQEQAFMDLVQHPDIVHYCLDRLFELAYQDTVRIYEALPGQVLLSYVAEDMGGQESLMISRRHIREFLLPRMKRMIDLAHSAGVWVFHHNDGNCRGILPDMVAAGIDLLNPLQWRSKGMERERLKSDFGDQIVLHGAMDNQYTLPFGTIEEVRQETLDNLRILGSGGGYVLAPCHNIQANTDPAKVVAMYQMGYEYGWS